jgi:hypothetical protein
LLNKLFSKLKDEVNEFDKAEMKNLLGKNFDDYVKLSSQSQRLNTEEENKLDTSVINEDNEMNAFMFLSEADS